MNMRKFIEEECMTPVNEVVITLIEDVLSIVTGLPEGKKLGQRASNLG